MIGAIPRDRSCDAQTPGDDKFVTFVAGGVGARATAPITLDFTNESTPFIVDSARHTIALQPHLKFHISDLRPDTRTGDQLELRLSVMSTVSRNVSLLVVMPNLSRGQAQAARLVPATAPGVRDFSTIGRYPKDAWVNLYLSER